MKLIGRLILTLLLTSAAYAAQDVVSAVHGTIKKIDSATKTIVIKTADGTEHSVHFIDKTAVHGADASMDAKDSWHGLKEGTEVVAHYTTKGPEDTAMEIDKVGKDGLKTTDGTIKDIDRGGKKLVVKSSDGVESTFWMTPRLRFTTLKMPARKSRISSRRARNGWRIDEPQRACPPVNP